MRLTSREVPLDRDASGPFLPWIVAVMVYLASLAVAAALLVHQVTERWEMSLADGLTIQVPPPSEEDAGAVYSARVDQLVRLLGEWPGVGQARHLGPAEVSALLEPWLGEAGVSQDLPVPALIAVELVPGAAFDLAALTAEMRGVAPGVLVDDHQKWLGDLLVLGQSVKIGALVVVLLIIASAVTAVVFLTRTGLAIHQKVISLLHVIGAHDSYIARQFQIHALRLGLAGGLFGLCLAAATILSAGAWLRSTENEVLPDLALSLGSWSVLLLLPPATALVAMVTARITVLRSLARMP
jgi:cell division transport system permease protein